MVLDYAHLSLRGLVGASSRFPRINAYQGRGDLRRIVSKRLVWHVPHNGRPRGNADLQFSISHDGAAARCFVDRAITTLAVHTTLHSLPGRSKAWSGTLPPSMGDVR